MSQVYADADLSALIWAGDEPAISQLVEQWSPATLWMARSFADSAQSAGGRAVQDAC
jgi:hypothetical protein